MTPYSIERKTISRRENGTELVRVTIARPTDFPFLRELTDRAEHWVDEELVPRAKQTFFDDPDPSKRFRFRRFEYDLCLSLTPVNDDVAELCIEATLARARGERLASARAPHYMRLSDGALLPPNMAVKLKKDTPKDAS